MNRRVPPLRTELDFKPITPEGLAAEIGGFECSRDNECRIQNCFTDREHLISANEAQGAEPLSEVEQLLRTHPDFIVSSICRWKHQRINVTWNRSEPISDEDGVRYLTESPVNLNPRQRKRLAEISNE